MARVVFTGLDTRSAAQLAALLDFDGHKVRRRPYVARVDDFLEADVVFVGGSPAQYLPLLRRLRALDRMLAVIVVSPVPNTAEWLDALEAGATDYCIAPFDMRQVRSLLTPRAAAVAMAAVAGMRR